MWQRLILSITCAAFVVSCTRAPRELEPVVQIPVHPKEIHREKRRFLSLPENFSVSPFPPMTFEEECTDWGKEYRIALCFADDFDLYRAITGFKRALCLLPPELSARRLELEYAVSLAYYLGHKYVEVAYEVESTDLGLVDSTFPAFQDLLLILYDSYDRLGRCEHAAQILSLIEQLDPSKGSKLALLSAIKCADINRLCCIALEPQHAYINNVLNGYKKKAKSIRKAETLNAVLPGAGYWYVGLKETAVTAFLMNTLFTAASAYFYVDGNPAAGTIFLSFECGWYFGGIVGGGYAAKYYNERLYCSFAEKITQREACFPLLMLEYTF
jgi:hypothetical protein